MTANATQECLTRLGVCATVLAYRRLYTDPAGSPFKFVFYNLKGASDQVGGQTPPAGAGFGTGAFGSGGRFSSFGGTGFGSAGAGSSSWGLPARAGTMGAVQGTADAALLKQAEADNPNPEKYSPVVATGFQDLEARAKLHSKELQTANSAMAESFEARLQALEQEQSRIADTVRKCRAVEALFQLRILKLCAVFYRPSEAVSKDLAWLEKKVLGQFGDSVLSRLSAVSDALELRSSSGGRSSAVARSSGTSGTQQIMGASSTFAGSLGASGNLLGFSSTGEPCELASLDTETKKQIRDHLALQGQRLVELCELLRHVQ